MDFKGHTFERFPQAARASRSLLGFRLGLFCFGVFLQVSAGEMCNVSHDSDLASFFKMLHCNIDHFEVGKMQSCVSLLSGIPKKRVSVRTVSGLSSYGFGHVAVITFTVSGSRLLRGNEKPCATMTFCSMSAMPPH